MAPIQRHVWPGCSTVSPFVITDRALDVIEFARTVFGADLLDPPLLRADGTLSHAVLISPDTTSCSADPPRPSQNQEASCNVYVPDCDKIFVEALAAGGDRHDGAVGPVSNGDRAAARWDVAATTLVDRNPPANAAPRRESERLHRDARRPADHERHGSRIGCIAIDCRTQDLSPASPSGPRPSASPASSTIDGHYSGPEDARRATRAPPLRPSITMRSSTSNRGLTNCEEEARRLGLGARRTWPRCPRWIVMEAPTGTAPILRGPPRQRPDSPSRPPRWGEGNRRAAPAHPTLPPDPRRCVGLGSERPAPLQARRASRGVWWRALPLFQRASPQRGSLSAPFVGSPASSTKADAVLMRRPLSSRREPVRRHRYS